MIKILGDINFADWYFDQGFGIGTAIKRGENPFKYIDRQPEDFWIGNFECVCADGIDKPFVISPRFLDKIPHMNLYGVANNHSMQVGDIGYNQTLNFLKRKDIPYVGSWNQKSNVFFHQGKKIGIMAFCMRPDNFTSSPLYWHIPELIDIENELQGIANCDYKICFVHWGYEFMNRPNIEQRQLAHWLVDSGVDLVVGMHSHVCQGAEEYKDKMIFYSLGNTLFNMAWEPTKYGLCVNVDLSSKKPIVTSDYLHIGNDFFPEILTDVPEKYSREYLDSLIKRTTENEIYFEESRTFTKQYTKANRIAILKQMIKMPFRDKLKLSMDFINRRILHK